ncbi:MAG: ABC transporter permease [Eubacteriales bacterium]
MKIKSFLKPYMRYVILAPLFMVLEVTMDLLQPKLMATVVNDGVLGGDIGIIVSTSIKMIIISLIGLVGGFGCTYFSSKASLGFGTDLRATLFDRTQSLSFEQTDRFSTGSLVTRLTNDVMQLQNMVLMSLRMFVRAPLLSLGGIIMALSINLKYGLVLLAVVPVIAGVIVFLLVKASKIFEQIQHKLDRLNAVLQENLTGIRVVKAYVRHRQEKKRFDKSNDDMTAFNMKMLKMMAFINPIMMVVMNAAVTAVIYMGALQVQAREAQIGDILAVITYITQVLMSIMMMSMLFMMISRANCLLRQGQGGAGHLTRYCLRRHKRCCDAGSHII